MVENHLTPAEDPEQLREQLEQERRSRQEAQTVVDALLHATSLDLYAKNRELTRLNTDLEERVHARTEELAQAAREAAKQSAAKGDFLARMSHEIRTPMNGVLGMLDALRFTQLDDTQRRYLNVAQVSARMLLQIIDDILDFSKIEAGKLTLEAVPVDLHGLLGQIEDVWIAAASDKGLKFEVRLHPPVPRTVRTDPIRLMQVLQNLITNAVKFTPAGSVRLLVESQAGDGDIVAVSFVVEDTGIGVSPDVMSRLFTAFSQAEESTSRRYGGTGLGLAICKQLVEMMGGRISATSEPGAGSRFQFVVPLSRCGDVEPQSIAEGRTSANFASARVLVVDDNEINRSVAAAILQSMRCTVTFATNGVEAIEAVRQDRPHLVLMDCHMPAMDGFEATRGVRDWEREHSERTRVPIIAVSASALPEDRVRCEQSGMDDFLAKPISTATIRRILQRWLPATSRQAGDAPAVVVSQQPDLAAAFDMAQLEEMRQVTANDFADLVARFREAATQQLAAIYAALEANDLDAARRAAHKLKGSSSTLGAVAVARSCGAVEQCAKGGDVQGTATHVEDLARECVRACDLLDSTLQSQTTE